MDSHDVPAVGLFPHDRTGPVNAIRMCSVSTTSPIMVRFAIIGKLLQYFSSFPSVPIVGWRLFIHWIIVSFAWPIHTTSEEIGISRKFLSFLQVGHTNHELLQDWRFRVFVRLLGRNPLFGKGWVLWRLPLLDMSLPCLFPFDTVIQKDFVSRIDVAGGNDFKRQPAVLLLPEFTQGHLAPAVGGFIPAAAPADVGIRTLWPTLLFPMTAMVDEYGICVWAQ
mmetsp:Transcript_25540/g.70528  ORF Transcript_25540/g.70528 Transcript_25540/m.70528 type:complete len:222 (+) Transcript_25540:1810-2475(+)